MNEQEYKIKVVGDIDIHPRLQRYLDAREFQNTVPAYNIIGRIARNHNFHRDDFQVVPASRQNHGSRL